MLEKLQMYINGEWVDSHSTETIEVMNPSDDSVLGMIAAGNSDDVFVMWHDVRDTALVDRNFLIRKEGQGPPHCSALFAARIYRLGGFSGQVRL